MGDRVEEFFRLASNYGFPMIVATYLLLRLEPTIKSLQKSITVLTIVVAKTNNIDYNEAKKMVNGKGED